MPKSERAPLKRFWAVLLAVLVAMPASARGFGSAGPQNAAKPKPPSSIEMEAKSAPAALAGREMTKDEGRSRTTWIWIAAAAVVALGVAALLLLKKKKASPAPSLPPPPPPVLPDTGGIDVRSTPSGARIYLDGVDSGKTTNAVLPGLAVGAHTVRLVLERYQDSTAAVDVRKDQTALVSVDLKPGGFTESFTGGPAAFWQAVRGTWIVQGGAYGATAGPPVNFACSQYTFADFGDFTFEVKCWITRPSAGSGRGHGILFRGAADLGRYYIFHVNPGSQVAGGPMWDVFEITNDQITRQYDPWTHANAIVDGLNVIKLVAQGSQFSFYANGVYLGARTIPEAPAAGRIGLGCEVDVNGSEVHFDDVVLTMPTAAAPASAPNSVTDNPFPNLISKFGNGLSVTNFIKIGT